MGRADVYSQPEAPDPVLSAELVRELAAPHLPPDLRVTGGMTVDESGGEARVYLFDRADGDGGVAVKAQRPHRLRPRTSLVKEAALLALPVDYHDRTPVGDSISRATADIDTIDDLFSSSVATLLGQVVRLATVAVAMTVLSPTLTAVAALGMLATVVTALLLWLGGGDTFTAIGGGRHAPAALPLRPPPWAAGGGPGSAGMSPIRPRRVGNRFPAS